MSCCQTLTSIPRDCEKPVGGIRDVYVNCESNVTSSIDETTKIATLTATSPWVRLEVTKQTGSLTTTLTTGDIPEIGFWDSVLALQFPELKTPTRNSIQAIVDSDLDVVVRDNNGRFWYITEFIYANATASTAVTGESFTDFSGYTLELTAQSRELPFEVLDFDPEAVSEE